MTSLWPRCWLGVAAVLVLLQCGCQDSTAPTAGSSVTGKALVTLHVEGMTERLELF